MHVERNTNIRAGTDVWRERDVRRCASMQPKVRYVRCSDGYVAYTVLGDGPTDLVLIFADMTHLELGWREPGLARFLGRLADWSRLISCDKRGFGLSDRISTSATIEDRVDEISAVLNAVGSERAALFGIWEGGQMAMAFAAQHPERTAALVLYGSGPRNTAAPDYDLQYDRALTEGALLQLVEHWGDAAAVDLEILAPSRAADPAFRRWFAELQRLACSPGQYLESATWALDIDVRDMLPSIMAPTLVLHRTGDLFCPVANGRYLADHIPDAQFVELDGNDHLPFVGDTDAITDAVESFVTGRITRRRRAADVVPIALRRNGVTRREFEVLDLVASGATNTEIAEQLHISVRTVESHISSLLNKVGSESRAGLIAAGISTRS
jgi:pimeloyl-ACP methyl ester carboxylesterase/DNA-binding CsgD family transcriptional regulator